jgi:isopentenyl-diphosphate delta-isomerase
MKAEDEGIASRKADHLDLCATDRVAFQHKGTLLDEVHFVHEALPELSLDEIDLTTVLCGKRLAAPVMIAAMTGGIERAAVVNRSLAALAEQRGLGFGFGSMRPLLEDPRAPGYHVRDVAPTALLFGNLGVVQAASASTQQVVDLVGSTGCDALCVHLNPAMEVVQPGGDRDFRGGLDAIARLVAALPVPVVAKETGCGLSRRTALRLREAGVRTVDVSGAGGTSWVGVETLRARATRSLGERYWDWGIPTAASIAMLSGLDLDIVATGGIRHGLDVARAIALGATVGGVARTVLTAWTEGGPDAAGAVIDGMIEEIAVACLLTGSPSPAALRGQPLVLGGDLARWVPRGSPLFTRALP